MPDVSRVAGRQRNGVRRQRSCGVKSPAADKPSRYLLTVSASDGAAYRVTTTKEILIERGLAHYSLSTAAQYSNSGESVVFRYAALESSKQVPVTYEWLRLEDRTSHSGELPSGGKSFTVNFAKPATTI